MTISTVHIVFKTHLDVGFTDYAANVVQRYIDDYFPRAIALADELGTGEGGFTWTTGSWILQKALTSGTPAQREAVDRAVREGKLAWHGLPFSTHTELMDGSLFDYGLSLSRDLDQTYGRTTLSAKMTDVPGHTVGMVPYLAAAGIGYLHIGVNPASAVPDVPPHFVWRAPNGAEIVVSYDASYGSLLDTGAAVPTGASDALFMAFTNDNIGPPSVADVRGLHASLRARYPDATITASTLNDFGATVVAMKEQLPVVDSEIGDSWIHGPGSDPTHLGRFLRLRQLRAGWVEDGSLLEGTQPYSDLSDKLLLVAEHTWGEDIKTFLPDFSNYTKSDFAAARERDEIDRNRIPDVHAYASAWSAHSHQGYSYSAVEQSWVEQRAYIDAAVEVLPAALREQVEDERRQRQLEPAPDYAEVVTGAVRVGAFTAEVDASGALTSLVGDDGIRWADEEHPLGRYVYQTFGSLDYQRWIAEYCRDMVANAAWALPDQAKIGMELSEPSALGKTFLPIVQRVMRWSEEKIDYLTVETRLPDVASETYGAPRSVEIRYRFSRTSPTVRVQLAATGKDANRLPEASWIQFSPLVANPYRWRLHKMGSAINPLDVVRNGNRNLHAVTETSNESAGRKVRIATLDAPLVSPGEPRLLRFDDAFPDLRNGMHFNLHNNVWGTNFRMWFDDDALYEFELTLS
jgi:hypothetical protein